MFIEWFFDINKVMFLKNFFILFLIFSPIFVFASSDKADEVFKARVVEILNEKSVVSDQGTNILQQNLRLIGIDGDRIGKEYFFQGIDSYQVLKNANYKEGDNVLLLESFDADGNAQYYVVDYVRTKTIYYLLFVFILTIVLVGKLKGLRSILSLVLTFIVIVKYIIPQILLGASPLFVTIIGSVLILFFIIYVTEGFKKISHLAVLSIIISLLISVFLSWFFVLSANLSGIFSEEIASLSLINGVTINFQGLLLAGIIIGLLGVLDDVVIAQISTVEQLYLTDKNQSRKAIFSKAYKVGISHISSMTNTLFLAYAGASLPLLVLLVSGDSVFGTAFDAINNEQIATEIVRTLSGSIGLILSVPISTVLAVYWYKK